MQKKIIVCSSKSNSAMCTQLLPLCCVCKLTQEKLWELHVNFFGSSLNDLEASTVAKKIVLLGVVGEPLKLKLNLRKFAFENGICLVPPWTQTIFRENEDVYDDEWEID